MSLDESYSSDSGSILSEPSYIAAYGAPAAGGLSGTGLRRHSMRLSTEAPRKRISRFLRPDFFDTPRDESVYAKHKKEKELETQEVLREIREKKNKGVDSVLSPRSPTESNHLKDDNSSTRKCLSPVGIILAKERSRSNTPFFPILDNIKELDTSLKYVSDTKNEIDHLGKMKSSLVDNLAKESKLIRPKSYPVKTDETTEAQNEPESFDLKNSESKDVKDSKLIRPKSYPASSPSPEKVYINRNIKKDKSEEADVRPSENRTDIEVTFSISLPKKVKPKENITLDLDSIKGGHKISENSRNSGEKETVLVLNKYKVVENNTSQQNSNIENAQMTEKIVSMGNGKSIDSKKNEQSVKEEPLTKKANDAAVKTVTKEDKTLKQSSETDTTEKKPTIKRKIIRKVSSKTKAGDIQDKVDNKVTEKKKVIKKLKDKINDDLIKSQEGKKDNAVKKKSVLQSLGQKFEKFTSAKSNTSDKDKSTKATAKNDLSKKEPAPKLNRNHREQSVPVQSDPPTESNLIKRAVTVTDVAALDNPATAPNRTTVSKVLGLFKKFDSKEKVNKTELPKINSDITGVTKNKTDVAPENIQDDAESDKPKRPTSLLLNGLGRKPKYGRNASDSISVVSMPNCTSEPTDKKDESKNLRNSLKLDFSRLPRVKKIVPTNPVIEPQIINSNCSETDKVTSKKDSDMVNNIDILENRIRSRSRSKSDNSSSDTKGDSYSQDKDLENNEVLNHHPHRNHETTTPDKEDIVERIRRKSFYSRFNEKRQRRKSNLVGPGATEYDPVARLHSQPDTKVSPTSPLSYDLSPGYSSVTSDLSPSTDRYKSLTTEPLTSRNSLRFDNYSSSNKVDSYRSLDRNDFRKHPSSRSYSDYEPPLAYGSRYARTVSLLDSSEGPDDISYLKEPHKYGRTLSMYAPGSYATYRPKRVRNSAIILKESEKEPSPENILDKIRQKKISISVTRKPELETEPRLRSNVPPKGEGDSPERAQKVD